MRRIQLDGINLRNRGIGITIMIARNKVSTFAGGQGHELRSDEKSQDTGILAIANQGQHFLRNPSYKKALSIAVID
jgi:hypothetical protein